MDEKAAITALSALAQASRLRAFRLLVERGGSTVPAGEIARELGIPHNTMSVHLAVLTRSGLLDSHRQGRSIRYGLNVDGIKSVFRYLVDDCCGGQPELCGPITQLLGPATSPRTVSPDYTPAS
ncbi:MAG: helix-turn-helix transcriptional regulator [Arenicellales bacterium]|nr:helix-turn-helix transcriptional regulator [Arenicellales bacterium]